MSVERGRRPPCPVFSLGVRIENKKFFFLSSSFAEGRSSCKKQPHKPVKVAKCCRVGGKVVVRKGRKKEERRGERGREKDGKGKGEREKEGRTSNVML